MTPAQQAARESVLGRALTQTEIDQIAPLQLGTEPDPIHYNTVSDALNVAEWRMVL